MASQRLYDLEPVELIRREMQRQERERAIHPDLRNLTVEDRHTLSHIWVAYVWTDVSCQFNYETKDWDEIEHEQPLWVLWGFRRKPARITWKAIKRIRRKLHVPRGATLQLVELWKAQRDGPPATAPQRYVRSTAPDVLFEDAIENLRLEKPKRRRYTKQRVTFGFGRSVEYVALGAPLTRNHTKPVFLGPLMANERRAAIKEARRMFSGMYGKHGVLVYAIDDFKKGARRRMRNGSIRPGKTRLDLARILEVTNV